MTFRQLSEIGAARQVILNLVRNASDAVSDVYDRARRLSVSVEQEDDDRVRVTVGDAGVGLNGQNIDTLFDPFLHDKERRHGNGIVGEPLDRRASSRAHLGVA